MGLKLIDNVKSTIHVLEPGKAIQLTDDAYIYTDTPNDLVLYRDNSIKAKYTNKHNGYIKWTPGINHDQR